MDFREYICYRVPTRIGKMGFLEKSGKITQNTVILGEFQTNVICYFLMIAIYTFGYYSLNLIQFSVKKTVPEKMGTITGRVGEFC